MSSKFDGTDLFLHLSKSGGGLGGQKGPGVISLTVSAAPPALEEALNFACDKGFPFSLSDGVDLMDFLCPLLKVSK